MSEFKIHHHLSELFDFFGINSLSAESYAEKLSKSATSYSSSNIGASQAVNVVAKNAPNAEAFIQKHEELKQRNVTELDTFVVFLEALGKEKTTLQIIENFCHQRMEDFESPTATERNFSLLSEIDQASNVKLSPKQIDEVRAKLLEGSKKPKKHPSDALIYAMGIDKTIKASIPTTPSWLNRPNLTLNFISTDEPIESRGPLGEVGVTTQEHQLLEDLLHLMTGCRATYITITPSGCLVQPPSISVDSSVEPSLKALVTRILPLVQHYSQVVQFVEKYSDYQYGMVNHALISGLRNILKDYMLLITQLETQQRKGTLTLNRLWFYIEKTLTLMEMLACLTTTIIKSSCHGGAVLSLLHERTLNLTGCGQLQDVMIYLTKAASIPYMKIFGFWIYRGLIKDPYSEFMIIDNGERADSDSNESSNSNVAMMDDFWQRQYSLHAPNIPIFLQPHADMILRTGKYLNVIRESDANFLCPNQEDLSYTHRDETYSQAIEKSYNFASKRLLQLLIQGKDLMGRLRSVKHFFLLDQGDFVVQMLTLCEEELSNNIDDVIPSRLVSLLELALRTSAANSHAYKDDVHCTLMPYSLMSQMMQILSIETETEREFRHPPERLCMTGLQGFSLTYDVKWPLSLIIDRKSQFCYQMIFRHLFYCKHVERLLCRVWVSNKSCKSRTGTMSAALSNTFMLRQRMLLFIQNLEYFMNFEVIEKSWRIFNAKMQKVESVDDVLMYHNDFLNAILNNCMLMSKELLRIISKLTAICVDFADYTLRPISDVDNSADEYEQTIARFDLQFTAMLITLVDVISDNEREDYNEALIHVIYRLDFNKYYTKKSEELVVRSASENSIDLLETVSG